MGENTSLYALSKMKITLQPTLLQWTRERAGFSGDVLARKMSVTEQRVAEWEANGALTYKQAQKLAEKTHVPLGYLFLETPPEEKLPIPDLRTVGSEARHRVSPDLLDVIYQSQRRQDWYREYTLESDGQRLLFVGSFPPGSNISDAAQSIREHLNYHPGDSSKFALDDVVREFSEAAEAAGVLVVRNGKVGNNTHRLLDPQEFRGFALVDEYAPLVFINARDARAAQIFTLAHELAHIWAGQSALSNLERTYAPEQKLERYCNAVAAEYLVPLTDLKQRTKGADAEAPELVHSLRRHYRVSDLVIIRRLYDAGLISQTGFAKRYQQCLMNYEREEGNGKGGNYHNNQPGQVSKRFGVALIASTLEGRTLYRDALLMLDMKKESSFKALARNLDFPL